MVLSSSSSESTMSSSSSSTTTHLRHHDDRLSATIISEHKRKQLKYVITGGAITWFTAILSHLSALLNDATGAARFFTYISVLLGITTILLFLYVVILPRIRGANPNYANWRDSPELASIIPVLTGSIVVGWTSLVFTLCTWSTLGTIWSLAGASGLYALCFGLIGLIPVPDY